MIQVEFYSTCHQVQCSISFTGRLVLLRPWGHVRTPEELHWGEVGVSGFFLKNYVNRLQRKENKCLRRVEDVTFKNNLLLPCLGPSWKSELKERSSVGSASTAHRKAENRGWNPTEAPINLPWPDTCGGDTATMLGIHTHTHKYACMLLLHFKTERRGVKAEINEPQ